MKKCGYMKENGEKHKTHETVTSIQAAIDVEADDRKGEVSETEIRLRPSDILRRDD